jgi:hypothetical protein
VFDSLGAMKLKPGDPIPHVRVTTVDGDVFSYATIWQRRNLVFAVVGEAAADATYATALSARASEFRDRDCECVVTRDEVPGLAAPSVLIADRWGEVIHISEAPTSAGLPGFRDLLEWVEYVRRRCPECEGEAH